MFSLGLKTVLCLNQETNCNSDNFASVIVHLYEN